MNTFYIIFAMYWLTPTFPVEIVQVFQLSLLSLRPGRSRDFEIGSYRQHGVFILLRLVCPWIIFNFKIILKCKHFFYLKETRNSFKK